MPSLLAVVGVSLYLLPQQTPEIQIAVDTTKPRQIVVTLATETAANAFVLERVTLLERLPLAERDANAKPTDVDELTPPHDDHR